jgi:hypothetical protein
MKTFLDNVIKLSAQRSRLWLACTAGLTLLAFLLSPGHGGGSAFPTDAANSELVSKRNCLPTNIKGTGDRLSPEELARVVAEYLPHTKDVTPSGRREAVLKLDENKAVRCDKDSESICFKDGVRKLCLPFEQ